MERYTAETSDCDFKRSLEVAKPKSWLKSISAFANTVGGTIFYGIDDDTHEVLGVPDPQSSVETITRLIGEKIDPLPGFTTEVIPDGEEFVVAVKVAPSMCTPHYYCSDGRREVYIRVGDRSIPAPPHILNELILRVATERTMAYPREFPFITQALQR